MRVDGALLALCLDVYEERMETDAHLPFEERKRAARAAAERVHAAYAPGAMAFIEKRRERIVVDEVRRARLKGRARPFIDRVLREANADGEVLTEAMLVGSDNRDPSAYPWAISWRHQLCWLLSREAGMGTRSIALVAGYNANTGAAKAIRSHDQRLAAAAKGKESSGHG